MTSIQAQKSSSIPTANPISTTPDITSSGVPRPSRSEGERSEPQRVLGLGTPGRPLTASLPDPEVEAKTHRRRFRVQDKLRILDQFDHCTNSNEVGALLRREGLYSSHLTAWRKQRQEGKLSVVKPQKRGRKEKEVNPLAKELLRLQRENQSLQLRLTQAEMIIDVQKKVSQLLSIALPQIGESNLW